MTKAKIFTLALAATAAATALVGCKEEDDTIEEYPNWQATNESYFNHLSDSVAAMLAQNPAQTEWKRIKTWAKPDTTAGENADYIIAHVLEQGSTTGATPLYTDTTATHFLGRLLPSTSQPAGLVFGSSYNEPFNEQVAVATQGAVSSYCEGFATALQHMRRGDKWRVYIPHQLGYGASGSGNIPGYSTLIFDITLVGFWSPAYTE